MFTETTSRMNTWQTNQIVVRANRSLVFVDYPASTPRPLILAYLKWLYVRKPETFRAYESFEVSQLDLQAYREAHSMPQPTSPRILFTRQRRPAGYRQMDPAHVDALMQETFLLVSTVSN